MKKSALILLGLTVSAVSFPVHAGNNERGWYIGLETGGSIPFDGDVSRTGLSTEAEYEEGYNAGAVLGFRYGNGFRSEIEADFNSSDFDSLNNVPATGDLSTTQLMVNAVYDYVNPSRFTPYIGGGLGFVHNSVENLTSFGGASVNDDDTKWGAQAILGASYAVNNWMDAFVQYKYVYSDDAELTDSLGNSVDLEHSNNVIQVGIRIALSSAAFDSSPAVTSTDSKTAHMREELDAYKSTLNAPEAKPAYLVFFDFDKSTLTAEAKEVLKKAADEVAEKKTVSIEVTGHADRAGSEKYNQGLSERRAQAVKQELIRLGMTKENITTYAKGESSPLVPTKDGVREPQNRRVEIVYPSAE